MERRCSNCIHSQFEGYCGQMGVCDNWALRTSYAELFPSKKQIDDEAEFNRRYLNSKPKKARGKSRRNRPPKKKKPSSPSLKSNSSNEAHEAYIQEDKRLRTAYEHRAPIHAFPRNGCTKARIIKEVRGWCRDHGCPYDGRYEDEPKEKLISRFICNEKTAEGKKTGNYRPDPVKVMRCFRRD